MAKHAHSTPMPAESNSDASQLNRRAALMALPAISGFAALAAAASRAQPVSAIDAGIERLKAARAEIDANEARLNSLYKTVDLPDWRVVNYMKNGKPVYANTAADIRQHWTPLAMFHGVKEIEQLVAEKTAALESAKADRAKVEDDCGLTALEERGEALYHAYDAAIDDLLSVKPATLAEARRKIDALFPAVVNLLTEKGEAERIFRALV